MTKNWAIAIGINHYNHHPEVGLSYAVKDAGLMRDLVHLPWSQSGGRRGVGGLRDAAASGGATWVFHGQNGGDLEPMAADGATAQS